MGAFLITRREGMIHAVRSDLSYLMIRFAGAVMYGCDPGIIQARRSRMSFGVRVAVPFQQDSPAASKFTNKENGKAYSNARYFRFVAKDDLVSMGLSGAAFQTQCCHLNEAFEYSQI